MEEQLLDFIISLKADKKSIQSFDEAATKQAIILQCLHILGWNTFSVAEVHPEYSVGKDRVDYSLRLGGANKVFLEAKKVGEDLERERHQKQLLNYSFQQGVKLAILSNGVTWWFYLPLQEGDWEQRKFYSIDIYQQEAEDIASKFTDFLSRENIASGKAFDNAEAAYKSQQRQKVLQENLPKAWNMLISKPDELLIELINETTERNCGYRADDNAVKRFLSKYREQLTISADIPKVAVPAPQGQPQAPQEKPKSIEQILGYMVDTKMRQTATELIEKISEWDKDNISVRPFKHCVSLFISRKVFTYLAPRKKFIKIGTYDKENDWRNFRIQSAEDIEEVIPLIKYSYEKLMQEMFPTNPPT